MLDGGPVFRIPVAALLLLLSGCTTVVQRIPFPLAEYEGLQQDGTATLVGQAFLTTRGGEVRYAAGREVLLNPVTSYSQQWFDVSYLGEQELSSPDPRYDGFIQSTIADAEGRFKFKDIAPGEYFVVTKITWNVAVDRYLLVLTGGLVAKKILVEPKVTTEMVLTWDKRLRRRNEQRSPTQRRKRLFRPG